jgi:hypothetical protein
VGIRCADHVTPLYPQQLAITSPTGGGRSVGIVRSRTKAMGFSFSLMLSNPHFLLVSQALGTTSIVGTNQIKTERNQTVREGLQIKSYVRGMMNL